MLSFLFMWYLQVRLGIKHQFLPPPLFNVGVSDSVKCLFIIDEVVEISIALWMEDAALDNLFYCAFLLLDPLQLGGLSGFWFCIFSMGFYWIGHYLLSQTFFLVHSSKGLYSLPSPTTQMVNTWNKMFPSSLTMPTQKWQIYPLSYLCRGKT